MSNRMATKVSWLHCTWLLLRLEKAGRMLCKDWNRQCWKWRTATWHTSFAKAFFTYKILRGFTVHAWNRVIDVHKKSAVFAVPIFAKLINTCKNYANVSCTKFRQNQTVDVHCLRSQGRVVWPSHRGSQSKTEDTRLLVREDSLPTFR